MDHADVCDLRNNVSFYEAMFHLFSETGRTAHQQGTVMQRCREIEKDPGYQPLYSQSLLLTHGREPGADTRMDLLRRRTTAKRPHCAAISSLVRPFRQDFDDDSYNQHRQANCNNAFMPGFIMKEPVAA